MRPWRAAAPRTGRLVVAAIAAWSLLTGAGCPKKPAAPAVKRSQTSTMPDSADQMAFGTRQVLTNKGVSNGELLSDTTYFYDDGTRIEMRRVSGTFYTTQGLKDGVLTAKAATYNTRLQRLEARGDVVVVREDGKRFSSQQLVFDQVRNQFFSDSAFVLNEPKREHSGIGFESDPKLNNFRCLRSCKIIATVQVPTR
ncbi:LPS export ABC transporter periplasmic protein LptC [Gemmatimonas sp.]|jgi:LPS export ABC transporter protein LptC|uniref:LPS export ABC transporter periplasmic protein LptC n=2 Tax=Gemmatimonas sp. TaxID=1962908 RepID=UPI0025C0E10B|nr:LPS export ABC transporter periplasmic protein LptC [Gemmatimonas sp.]MCA2990346.1 LPS export ABC transporter periplasmic protein LptC [Gemmatimonas sp.]